MKTLKVLIIEDQQSIAGEIAGCIMKVIPENSKVDFIYATEYEQARIKTMSDDYDVVSLSENLGGTPTFHLIGTILKLHPKAVIFFLASSEASAGMAKKAGISFSLLKEALVLKIQEVIIKKCKSWI